MDESTDYTSLKALTSPPKKKEQQKMEEDNSTYENHQPWPIDATPWGECKSRSKHLAILWDLFGMVKWPFQMVKWPPTRGWKGHFESPGMCCLILLLIVVTCHSSWEFYHAVEIKKSYRSHENSKNHENHGAPHVLPQDDKSRSKPFYSLLVGLGHTQHKIR